MTHRSNFDQFGTSEILQFKGYFCCLVIMSDDLSSHFDSLFLLFSKLVSVDLQFTVGRSNVVYCESFFCGHSPSAAASELDITLLSVDWSSLATRK